MINHSYILMKYVYILNMSCQVLLCFLSSCKIPECAGIEVKGKLISLGVFLFALNFPSE